MRDRRLDRGGKPLSRAGDYKSAYHERYDDLKKKGKAFYPYSVSKDILVSVLIFLILILLVIFFGIPLESKADPTNANYVPRPEWYFMFLFEMLKYFPGELEPLAVAVIPSLGIAAMFLLPFIDRRSVRVPQKRPLALSMGALGMLLFSFLTIRSYQTTPTVGIEVGGIKLTATQATGKTLYQAQNCAVCHSMKGVGGTSGSDLAGIGSRKEPAAIHQYIENPKAVNPNSTMPAFLPPLSHKEVDQIVQYLLATK